MLKMTLALQQRSRKDRITAPKILDNAEREFIPSCNCTQLKLVLNTGAFGTHGNNYRVIKPLQGVLLQ